MDNMASRKPEDLIWIKTRGRGFKDQEQVQSSKHEETHKKYSRF
jgi:hypothetical protein